MAAASLLSAALAVLAPCRPQDVLDVEASFATADGLVVTRDGGPCVDHGYFPQRPEPPKTPKTPKTPKKVDPPPKARGKGKNAATPAAAAPPKPEPAPRRPASLQAEAVNAESKDGAGTSRADIVATFKQQYKEVAELGKGAFGEVMRVRRKFDQAEFAAKVAWRSTRASLFLLSADRSSSSSSSSRASTLFTFLRCP